MRRITESLAVRHGYHAYTGDIQMASKEELDARLIAMEADYESGKRALMGLDSNRQTVATSLVRMEGAMTMLRELGATTPVPEVVEGASEPLVQVAS